MGLDWVEEEGRQTYGGNECSGYDRGRRGGGYFDGADLVDHFTEFEFADCFEAALVFWRYAVDVLAEDDEIAFGITFEVGVFIDFCDGGCPGCGEVAGDFFDFVVFAGVALDVADYGETFHEIAYSNYISVYCYIDGCCGCPSCGYLLEDVVFEGVNHELLLSV